MMSWCMLLAAASVASPWAQNSCRTYYYSQPMPVYVTCQPAPVCAYPPTMVCGPTVAEVVNECAPAVAEEKKEEDLEAVSAEEEDELATEFVDFAPPAPYRGDLALDWGTASIGAGTLYPTPQGFMGGGGGFFPWGSGTGSNGSFVAPNVPPTVINNIINNTNNNNGGGGGPNPIPEPASIAVWAVGGLLAGYVARRRRMLQQKAC